MSQRCTVCAHQSRSDIDLALADPEVNLSLIGRETGLSRDALRRHRGEHLPRQLVSMQLALHERADALRAEHLHAQAQALYLRALDNLARAESGVLIGTDGKGRATRAVNTDAVTKALREARAGLGLLAELAMRAPTGDIIEPDGTVRSDLDVAVERALRSVMQRTEHQREEEIAEAEVISDRPAPAGIALALASATSPISEHDGSEGESEQG
jgi:hypothetical protein